MLRRWAATCSLIALVTISALYASTTFQSLYPAQHEPVQVDVRIGRLVKNVQRLQKALAKATAAPEPNPASFTEESKSCSHRFAYVFYATTDIYACSVLVNMARLRDLNSTIPIHILISSDVSTDLGDALEDAGGRVHEEIPPKLAQDSAAYYKDCLLKMLAFKMHMLEPGMERVLVLDADQLSIKNMDHLFEALPEVDLAAPRAYWLAKDFISTTFLMISLSDRLWETVEVALDTVGYDKFDMDLINDLLGDTVMMLSGEYDTINSHFEDWNLPAWFHPDGDLNTTTVNLVNNLVAKLSNGVGARNNHTSRSSEDASNAVSKEVAQHEDESRGHLDGPYHDTDIKPQAAPSPRFPVAHPITRELYRLKDQASVIHFFAVGKPWAHTAESVHELRPDAHPLLADLMEEWRRTAGEVCPGGILSESD